MGEVVPTSQNLRDYIERDIPEENTINSANVCPKITHQSDSVIFISKKKKKKNMFQQNLFGGHCCV